MPRPVIFVKAKVLEIAKAFATRSDFAKGASSAYQAARRGKFLDEVCSHMVIGKKGRKPKAKVVSNG